MHVMHLAKSEGQPRYIDRVPIIDHGMAMQGTMTLKTHSHAPDTAKSQRRLVRPLLGCMQRF